jgi:subtilisin
MVRFTAPNSEDSSSRLAEIGSLISKHDSSSYGILSIDSSQCLGNFNSFGLDSYEQFEQAVNQLQLQVSTTYSSLEDTPDAMRSGQSSRQVDSDADTLTGLSKDDSLLSEPDGVMPLNSSFTTLGKFNSTSGYGLVNASAAVSSALNTSPFADVPDLGGNTWGNDMVKAPEAWAAGYTGQDIVVAVVDSGVDYTHTDLDGNIWTNSGEISGNGVDDDQNGFIDDVNGWDFVNSDNDPMDDNGHGTHVAGTIAAENNSEGISGVAYNAKIMPVKVMGQGGGGSGELAKGIRYAAMNGAKVINLSWASSFSSDIEAAVQDATKMGAVVVMGAGNDGGSQPDYPAKYAAQRGLAVGAVDSNRTFASFSNQAGTYSRIQYVVAPGVDVYSTLPGNTCGSFSGTSMAAPHVAGVVALMLSANPNLTPDQVRQIITGSAVDLGGATFSTIDQSSRNQPAIDQPTVSGSALTMAEATADSPIAARTKPSLPQVEIQSENRKLPHYSGTTSNALVNAIDYDQLTGQFDGQGNNFNLLQNRKKAVLGQDSDELLITKSRKRT